MELLVLQQFDTDIHDISAELARVTQEVLADLEAKAGGE
jgi:hypothetical protein